MEEVTIYTDGACSGNPGPGGWGAMLMYKGNKKEISGGKENTTNNVMELTAVIEGIKLLKEAKADSSVLTLKSYEALSKVAEGASTKIIIPSNMEGIATFGTVLNETLKKNNKEDK